MWRSALVQIASMLVAGVMLSCGDGNQQDAGILVVAEDTRFRPTAIRLDSGDEVTLTLENRDAIEHDLEVEGLNVTVVDGGIAPPQYDSGGHGDTSGAIVVHTDANETRSITFVALDSGTYEFFCTITGHEEAGMVGTLTVE